MPGDGGQHRGAVPSAGPFVSGDDPRINRLGALFNTLSPDVQSKVRQARDPDRVAGLFANQVGAGGPGVLGYVVCALPHVDWYKVWTAEAGAVACCRLRQGSATPMGPREGGVIPPGNVVLVQLTPSLPYGVIYGVLPAEDQNGRFNVGDWVQQGGPTGLRREEAYLFPILGLDDQGGVRHFGAGRPLDETSLDRSLLSELGVGWHVDAFQAYLRAGEFCGLFLNYIDQFGSFRARWMEQFSGAHYFAAGDDEGEPYAYHGEASFPGEARGRYSPGQPVGKVYSDREVQYERPVGKVDLEEADRDLDPVHRSQRYGGYAGQGGYRFLMRPAREGGARHRAEASDPDYGLFLESVQRDGGLTILSARGVHIGLRHTIAVPRRRRLEADPEGDDAEAGNYKAAGTFGGGEPHRLREPQVTGRHPHVQRAVAALELAVYALNWKAGHAFHYHREDFHYPQEDELRFEQAREQIDFSPLARASATPPPTARPLRVDPVYGNVDYYAVESSFQLLPDGGLCLRSGCGGSIMLSGGNGYIDVPGSLFLRCGHTFVAMGEQAVVKAKRSVDVSADEHDVRVVGRRNVQITGGVDGRGSVLIEGRGEGRSQLYEEKVGEEVDGGGVVIKAGDGVVGLVGKDLYVRSTERAIVIDSAEGAADLNLVAKNVSAFVAEGVDFYLGPANRDPTVNAAYNFRERQCVLAADVLVGGNIFGSEETDIYAGGSVLVLGSVACAGSMADRKGWFLGKIGPEFTGQLQTGIDQVTRFLDEVRDVGGKLYTGAIVQTWYSPMQLGNADTIEAVTFTFRDKPEQYGTQDFVTVEPRWQELVRLGAASGGVAWAEKPVDDLYSWPGTKAWTQDESMLRAEPALYDPATGNAAARPYDNPTIETAEVVPLSNTKTIR